MTAINPTPAAAAQLAGAAFDHPELPVLPLLVAPATRKEKNVHRMELVSVACWRVDDVRFTFGGSFVLPETASEFTALADLTARHRNSPLSVFGHADPVGDEAANKAVSTRRAEAVYAVLVRDTSRWEKLYKDGPDWGEPCLRTILATLGYQPGTEKAPFQKAVEMFQNENGLRVDGIPGPQTREKLFAAYMDRICRTPAGEPFILTKENFLGRGADPSGQADFQGCGEFNPVMIFSQAESRELGKAENKEKRDGENSVNRRVVVLLFQPGTEVPAGRWPCTTSLDGCRKRFWSDAAKRTAPAAARREFGSTADTFGCRFYQRLTGQSPCEGVAPSGYFQIQIVDDESGNPIEGVELRITLSSGVIQEMSSDVEGKIFLPSAPPGVCRVTSDFEDLPVTMSYDFIKLV